MKLGCLTGVEYKNKVIFSSTYINGLFELDIKTEKIRFIKAIIREKCEAFLFRKAFLFKNEAWFIPHRGAHVICVDLDTYDIEYFELQYNQKFKETKDKVYPNYCAYFDGLIVNEEYLYCIPNGLDSLLIINLKKHLVVSVNVFNDPLKDIMYGAYFYQGKVHLLSQKGLLDKTICIGNNDIEERGWKFNSAGFLSPVQQGTNLYLIPAYLDKGKTRKLAQIDLISENIVYIDMEDTPEEYYGGMLLNKYLLLFPNCGMNFIKMNIEKKIFEKVSFSNELKYRLKNCNNASRIIASEKRKLCSLIYSGYILEFDEEGNILNYFDVNKLEDTEVQKIIVEYKKKDIAFSPMLMKEKEILSLYEYIQLI